MANSEEAGRTAPRILGAVSRLDWLAGMALVEARSRIVEVRTIFNAGYVESKDRLVGIYFGRGVLGVDGEHEELARVARRLEALRVCWMREAALRGARHRQMQAVAEGQGALACWGFLFRSGPPGWYVERAIRIPEPLWWLPVLDVGRGEPRSPDRM